MLVAFSVGLWVYALFWDLVRASGGGAAWSTAALYAIACGIVGAVLAAVPCSIDYLSIDEADMRRIATTHLLLGLGALVIFAVDLCQGSTPGWTAKCHFCCPSSGL
jgi:uncharacterized membrane protein